MSVRPGVRGGGGADVSIPGRRTGVWRRAKAVARAVGPERRPDLDNSKKSRAPKLLCDVSIRNPNILSHDNPDIRPRKLITARSERRA